MLEIAGHIASIVEAIAVLITAVLAWRALSAWRKELLGKRQLEVAEQALLACYELKERFQLARERIATPGFAGIQAFEMNRSHYFNRLGVLGQTAYPDPLSTVRPLFRVYFGFESTKPIDRLLSVTDLIRRNLSEVFTSVPSNGTELTPLDDLIRQLGWEDCERPDKLDFEFDRAVREVEEICRPILGNKL